MALKYDLIVRAVASEVQPIADKHALFLNRLDGLAEPWGVVEHCPAPDPGRELVAIINWARIFGGGKGIGGDITYQFRHKFRDEAFHDDKIMLSFDPKRIDYGDLIDTAFPRYVAAFDGYFAEISDQGFSADDWDGLPEDFDARHDLYRLPPVCFMRADFCERALNLTAQEIAARLDGQVALVREMLDGVLVVLTYEILPTGEMDRLCWEKKALLTV